MRSVPGRSHLASGEKSRFAHGDFGFRNASGERFLESLDDGARVFIPETGRSYQKVKKLKSTGANPDVKKIS
jgi:hypothetical protein